jgi:DNA polymerase type B, organellar and viral
LRSSAERVASYRQRQREAGAPDSSRRPSQARQDAKRRYKRARRAAWRSRPFCGCDGEGAGTDELGRQLYMLFRMGDRELFTGEPLTTRQILRFICDHPPDQILVGFAFGYDVTMILRDLSETQCKRLFAPRQFGPGRSSFTWFHEFEIDYLPRQYFRVRRVRYRIDPETRQERRVVIKGSTRTIYETFGFFQKPFAKVLNEFEVGTASEREQIAYDKSRRGSDDWQIGDDERAYCAMECRFLTELMDKLRGYCDEANIKPKSWSGAGRLAAALHEREATIRADLIETLVPPGVLDYANFAYYGGRFEVTRTGSIDGPIWEYDIRSAYPAAMHDLPCLLHGAWRFGPCGKLPLSTTYCAGVRFSGGREIAAGALGALPIRSKEGYLFWPWRGGGVYWSCELAAAKNLGFRLNIGDGWIYEKQCDCRPFAWVEDLYEFRRKIGSSGPGYPIKLGINALYGKLAQRKGNGAFNNLIWAGMITAMTRAQLLEAVALATPGAVLMLATDALYTTEPLPLPVGPWLGNWEEQQLDGLFIVQPGLYWSPDRAKRKARGLPGRFFEGAGLTDEFQSTWTNFQRDRLAGRDVAVPGVSVPVPGFVGLRLAHSRGAYSTAGRWIDDRRQISFDWRNKRAGGTWRDGAIVTAPKLGAHSQLSLPHRDFLKAGGNEPWEAARLQLDEQPDFVDLSAPWSD